jgi:hypothetical protein
MTSVALRATIDKKIRMNFSLFTVVLTDKFLEYKHLEGTESVSYSFITTGTVFRFPARISFSISELAVL